MKNLIFSPNLLNKNATAKNLIPLPKIEAGPSGGWLVLANEPTTEATLLGESWPGKLRSANTDLFRAPSIPLQPPVIFLNKLFVGVSTRRGD